ncbi:hypothetical protein DAPPUDRAFT_315415 [Daphnia pulex]|uniref:Uncharacterized protein n=1 Tax=Daphnia pulex TaxID=6669 RepID=E9G9N9_DAPPU|nr:hypothetical protein DAPPUDRAFT_315415 [Daphnia pulex]|eukprot:EFX83599.1 hypothetical protein DAPPUDRAFT_315415 [Daphnia pulex]
MAKAFGALIKVIHDLVASELTDVDYDMNIYYVMFLALEIILCFIIACVNIDLNDNIAAFRRFSFFFALNEMGCATIRDVMDVMLTRGEFYGSLQNPNNTFIV